MVLLSKGSSVIQVIISIIACPLLTAGGLALGSFATTRKRANARLVWIATACAAAPGLLMVGAGEFAC